MSDFSERITKIRSEIQTIKTNQASQNDSYRFYFYKSANLYTTTEKLYEVEFQPIAKDPSQVVCNFTLTNYSLLGTSSSLQLMPWTDNPLCASLDVFSIGTSLPDAQKIIYVGCISNCEGILKVTEV